MLRRRRPLALRSAAAALLLAALMAGMPVDAAKSGTAMASATVVEGVKVLDVLGTPVSLAALLNALLQSDRPAGPATGDRRIRLVVQTPLAAAAQALRDAVSLPGAASAGPGMLQSGIAAAVSLMGSADAQDPVSITVAFN